MKKVLAILCIVLGLLGFCACEQNTEGEQNKPDEIAVAYAELHNGKASDVVYDSYGEFDGTNVLIISFKNAAVSDALNTEIVDGVDFHFSVLITFDVYRKGAFYTLQEAFNNKWLTHEDLLTVRSNHKKAHELIYEYFEEQKEDEKSPIVLEKAVKQEIKAAFVEANKNEYSLCEEEISLRCYGAFDGLYVLYVDVESWMYPSVVWSEVVADVEFVYGSGQSLKVYSDGAFYSLSYAYENGFLTRDNLLTVQQNRRGH
ncbi:MAG: hypothetical protein J1G05_04835 [Clostridiales bacterium]|nr:hypothetical protein [Clostridiales bacterium]